MRDFTSQNLANTAWAFVTAGIQKPKLMQKIGAVAFRITGQSSSEQLLQLLQFFQGYRVPKGVEGVHMVIGPFRKFNGEAYVEFVSEAVANDALAKDRAIMGNQGRYVAVGCRRATPLLSSARLLLCCAGECSGFFWRPHLNWPRAAAFHAHELAPPREEGTPWQHWRQRQL